MQLESKGSNFIINEEDLLIRNRGLSGQVVFTTMRVTSCILQLLLVAGLFLITGCRAINPLGGKKMHSLLRHRPILSEHLATSVKSRPRHFSQHSITRSIISTHKGGSTNSTVSTKGSWYTRLFPIYPQELVKFFSLSSMMASISSHSSSTFLSTPPLQELLCCTFLSLSCCYCPIVLDSVCVHHVPGHQRYTHCHKLRC